MSINLIAKVILRLCALCLCILCSSAFCLTLGNLKVYSLLNQPLKANIEILHADDIEMSEILPNLASVEDFKLANLERTDVLSDIECKVITDGNNKSIEISTFAPIQQPSISLLIEVHWPHGRILKEYSLLLTPYHVGELKKTSANMPMHTKVIQPPSKVPSIKEMKYNFYYTKKGDTLWSIASMVAAKKGITPQRAMQLIFNANPKAFLNGNKSKLKSRYKLRIPNIGMSANNQVISKRKGSITTVSKQSHNADSNKQNAIDNLKGNADSTKQAKIDQDIKLNTATNLKEDNTLAVNEENVTDANKQSIKPDLDTSAEPNKKNIEEATTIKKEPPSFMVKHRSFLNIYTISTVFLILLAFGIALYRRLSKKTGKTDMSSDDNEIVDDYSQKTQEDANRESTDNKSAKSSTRTIDKAEKFIAKNEPQKAILILNQALSIKPKDPEINFKLTELYCNLNDKDNARKMMANGLQINNNGLRAKLMELKTKFPKLFVQQAVEDAENWSIDTVNVKEDDISPEEGGGISSTDTANTKDELSFLADSELSGQSTVDELFTADAEDTKAPKKNTNKLQDSKLDVAKGYIDIGDDAEAIKLLNEIISSGTEEDQEKAKQLLDNLEGDKSE